MLQEFVIHAPNCWRRKKTFSTELNGTVVEILYYKGYKNKKKDRCTYVKSFVPPRPKLPAHNSIRTGFIELDELVEDQERFDYPELRDYTEEEIFQMSLSWPHRVCIYSLYAFQKHVHSIGVHDIVLDNDDNYRVQLEVLG